ncbi:Calcium-activated chloride channel regulator 4 [Pteropus alecto]|uniref:Calcium-activated chloride channel regulator 1 n=1 Tax=Pteropus alecto TaxID=9402 RepID=L5K4N7_PTEAL|nr:Calcium-activated chloride channel regulator 4 [Pteropus alecto]
MGLFRNCVFFLVLYLLPGSNTSLVQLNANGFEGIIIAIDPGVPEDETLIEQIKDMVTTASTYLFEATEKRLFFKNVSILIPDNWKKNPQYKRPKHESYKHADVLVAPPTHRGRDEPYTKQFTACEEKGEYIYFSPDFVLGKKQNEYGPRGRRFVHEWAHLRWGVFDEYNDNEPYYSAKSKKIEATRHDYLNFLQLLRAVVKFCNEKNHNREAPSLQNKMCNARSTWEVISNSEDLKSTTPMVGLPPPPVFSLLRISERIVCLVLDKSGSMANFNRLNRMNQAAKHFLLQITGNGSWVGMVHFDSTANIKSKLIQITSSNEKKQLLNSLPTVANGGTSICAGIESAFQVIREIYPQIDGSEIVLLTDGEDSSAKNCVDKVKQSGAIIHFIALGPSADAAVIQMSNITDQAENNGLIDAFGALASGNTDIPQQSVQLESKGLMLNNDPWMNGTVIIDSTVGKDTFFLVTWVRESPIISLWDPNGTLTGSFTVDRVSKMAYLSIPGTAKVGVWTYSLRTNANLETLTITVNSRAANSSVPPITLNAKMNKDTNSFPSPMIVYAEILQGNTPILGANVTAFIESNSGKTQVLELLDNGAGTIEVNPPRPEIDEDTQTNLESFIRTVSGGAFVVSNVSIFPLPDLYPPSQITDLEATPIGDVISLTWTAPGDDFDVGKVQQYIIRISGSILDLRDNFEDALQVNSTDLSPKEANSKEIFAFKPGNISEENATHIFIAIQSVDKSNLTSKVSNIAQVALFIPQADPDESDPNPTPDENYPNSKVSFSFLVLIVVGSVVIVLVILGITICVSNKKRNSSRPRTQF